MLSIQFIRQNPEVVRQALRDRGEDDTIIDQIIKFDAQKGNFALR